MRRAKLVNAVERRWRLVPAAAAAAAAGIVAAERLLRLAAPQLVSGTLGHASRASPGPSASR
jgi:hypothetical protein